VSATLNDSFYPILLSSMEEPLQQGELDAYFQKLIPLADAGIRKREQYIVIVLNDPMKFSAAARKKVLEAQARYLSPAQMDVTLASFVYVNSAFARGAVTALRWVAPELIKSVRLVANLEAAMNDALALLEAEGRPFRGNRQALRRELGLSGGRLGGLP
jgi:hypothetical protein